MSLGARPSPQPGVSKPQDPLADQDDAVNNTLRPNTHKQLAHVVDADMAETVECWWEAKRADDVAAALTRIRTELEASSHADITNVINEVLHSGSLLRDLSDLLRIYRSRVCLVRDFLLIFLPCFERTMDDIRHYLGEKGASYKRIWMIITAKMSVEASTSVYTRFIMYNGYMVQLVRLLSR